MFAAPAHEAGFDRLQPPGRAGGPELPSAPPCILGNPRFPLKGALKGDTDIAIDIDVDIDIDLDDRGT